MPTPQTLVVKTVGWLVQTITYQNIVDTSTWTTFTNDRRFAWGLQQRINLQGIAMDESVLYPQGFAIQETHTPEGFNHAKSIRQGEPASNQFGMPWGIEIHDLWLTTPMTQAQFNRFAGLNANEQLGPAFLPPAEGDNENYIPYKDFEQVVAARSRIWLGDTLGLTMSEITQIIPQVRQQPARRLHDVYWGSGDPIASQDLYHVRLCITRCGIDTTGGQDPAEWVFWDNDPLSPWFCWVPPSIQPMLVVKDKPSFIARITMERRSKAV